MTRIGSSSTRLIILRGDSASGKTTATLALRAELDSQVAIIHQDYIRREMLHNADRLRRARDASALIIGAARQALDLGYDVILDGIFNLRDYSEPFERLHRDHRGLTRIYQFDVGLDETIRRHAGRPLASAFGEEKLREWYDGWQPLPWLDERRIGREPGSDEIVSMILQDLDVRRG
ncbi:AAA family ATPase [Microbacterium sp. M]|uniref:AAA family ATPase n=1 Tax=Microbacterium sp. M TaxID=3377125 RepID=UPI00386C8741